jgi:hypothetical protein
MTATVGSAVGAKFGRLESGRKHGMTVTEYHVGQAVDSVAYPNEVLEFAERMGGTPALDAFRRLAGKYFPYATLGNFEYVSDPGADEKWLALSLKVRVPARCFLRDQSEFFTAWSREATEASERLAVLLPNFE